MTTSVAKVLVVDDNSSNRQLAALMLRRLGCTTVLVENGHDALQAYAAERFSVILMDWQMPGLDGLETTAMIRTIERGVAARRQRTPIIAWTANALAGDRQRCLDAGMDDYISKPVRLHELREVLLRWLTAAGVTANASDGVAAETTAAQP